ncbi:MAG: TetR/AcrR family transcriptional regulator, partial [Clostridia bacterium]|nr:TetR/AcrR family transcriptional regulator [Clostridia bacterium]
MTELFGRIPEEKRSRIMEAAISEFAGCGYESANINHIAQKARVSVGSLYKYFDNKQDLFLSMVQFGSQVLKSKFDEVMQGDEDILVKVEKLLRTIQRHSREQRSMIRLYNEMTTQCDPLIVKPAATDMETPSAELYSSLILQMQQAGVVRGDIDVRMFAFLLDNIFMMLQFGYACDYY